MTRFEGEGNYDEKAQRAGERETGTPLFFFYTS